jgi:uncharacterized protein YigA (DUF484 family)
MRALVEANGDKLGRNVVDLRGVLVDRLEDRLDRLEDTHRSVIAAAYENLAGTNQIHRAALAVIEPVSFDGFLQALVQDVSNILSVDETRLCLESSGAERGQALGPKGDLHEAVVALKPGDIERYLTQGSKVRSRKVTLRQNSKPHPAIFGVRESWVRSEALIKLDLGEGKLPGLLVFGAEDPHRFHPDQGVDLLTFFGGVFERMLRQWLK